MVKYVTRPKADWSEFPVEAVTTREVIVGDEEPVKMGLVDAQGVPIYRVRERLPVGFVRN
jgi:hypothetical protein